MEIAENEENNTTNLVNWIVYTISICVHISAGTGFIKEVYLQSLKRIICVLFFKTQKIRHLFRVLNVKQI